MKVKNEYVICSICKRRYVGKVPKRGDVLAQLDEVNKNLALRQQGEAKAIRQCNELLAALKRSYQTMRNIWLNLPDGDLKQIAMNETDNMYKAIAAVKGDTSE